MKEPLRAKNSSRRPMTTSRSRSRTVRQSPVLARPHGQAAKARGPYRLPDLHHDPFVQTVTCQAEDGWRAVEPDRVARLRLGKQHPPRAAPPGLSAHQPGLDGG